MIFHYSNFTIKKSCHTSELPYVFQAMDVIRSNYSTLGPLAQQEAPKPPEFPYSEILKAYRGAFEASIEDDESSSSHNVTHGTGEDGTSQNNATHTKAFQRIIDHFFGDYFTVDADEELASDMAERWAAFASEGAPNYDASKVEWRPWRYKPVPEPTENDESVDYSTLETSAEDFWNIPGEYDDFSTNYEGTEDFDSEFDEEVQNEQMSGNDEYINFDVDDEYRRRALEALNLEVADNDDVFRTELRQVNDREGDSMHKANTLFKRLGWVSEYKYGNSGKKRSFQEVLRIARKMGVIGVGLTQGETTKSIDDGMNDEEFFPHLLEISWPPELRLIEKDCTCDMWDRIRCKYRC